MLSWPLPVRDGNEAFKCPPCVSLNKPAWMLSSFFSPLVFLPEIQSLCLTLNYAHVAAPSSVSSVVALIWTMSLLSVEEPIQYVLKCSVKDINGAAVASHLKLSAWQVKMKYTWQEAITDTHAMHTHTARCWGCALQEHAGWTLSIHKSSPFIPSALSYPLGTVPLLACK